MILLFARRRSELERRAPSLAGRLEEHGGLWLAWPKGSSGAAADLSSAGVRAIGFSTGLVDNKVCAIDETWSGLRFVRRLADRGNNSRRGCR